MKKIRLGIIGAGWIAKQHLEVIKAIDGLEAVGIASRTREKAERLKNEYGLSVCAADLAELVDKSVPDALLVLVSPENMFDMTLAALKYKLPLFIEKPAGLSPEENHQLAALAKRDDISTMVGFNRRYYSIFRKGLDIIREHGQLLGVFVEGHERVWRVRESKSFSDQVLDSWIYANSTHTIDLLRYFGGEASNVNSIAHKYLETRGDQFAAVMEMASGAIGQYSAHWHSPGGWKVVLYGEGVTVEFKPLEKGFWTDKDFKTHEIAADEADLKFKPGFLRQMEAFEQLARNGRKAWPMTDLEGSYQTMLLAQKISSGVKE